MEIFWKTIANYNMSTWVCQVGILLAGMLLTATVVYKPRPWNKMALKIFLIAVSLWISVIYYYGYCIERSYYNVMSWFWGIIAIVWLWDLFTGFTTFQRNGKYVFMAWILLLMPLIYPLISLARGLRFPQITSPVMPCSIVTYMIGLQLLFSNKVNMFLILLLCHWSFIGLSKTYVFNIPEDFLLASASLPAVYLFFKDYFNTHLQGTTKPAVIYIHGLLIFVFIALAAILGITFVKSFI